MPKAKVGDEYDWGLPAGGTGSPMNAGQVGGMLRAVVANELLAVGVDVQHGVDDEYDDCHGLIPSCLRCLALRTPPL